MCYLWSKDEYGQDLNMDKVGCNTIKLMHDPEILDTFMESPQAKFWAARGHPFVKLTPEECKTHVPLLGE